MGTAKHCWNQGRIERFEYPVMPLPPAAPSLFGLTETLNEENTSDCQRADGSGIGAQESACKASMLAEESRRAFSAGRERGLLEGRQLERESSTAAQKTADDLRRQQMAVMIGQLAEERDRYLRLVEREVVKLALAVAARILRREAQMDPLLLTGAVRVALGQLSGSTEVRVRVPAAEFELWKDALAHLPNPAIRPQVIAGDGMRLGDCVIETALGSVDLGIRSQLGEIERGFFDNAVRRRIDTPETQPPRETAVAPA